MIRRALRLVSAVAALLVLCACEVRTELGITVADDGSGVVEFTVELDDVASSRLDALGPLDLGDLESAGWSVVGPETNASGETSIGVSHPFDHPDQLGALVAQVAGDEVFRDFRVTRTDAFAETRWEFRGTVDFGPGEEVVDDPTLDAALDDAGVDADALALVGDRLGSVIDDRLRFRVGVRLPGDVTSNAPTRADNGAIWTPSVSDRTVVELRATGSVTRTDRVVWAVVAGLAGLALVLFLCVRVAVAVRGRGGGGGSADTE